MPLQLFAECLDNDSYGNPENSSVQGVRFLHGCHTCWTEKDKGACRTYMHKLRQQHACRVRINPPEGQAVNDSAIRDSGTICAERRLRKDPDFAAEYLKAALEDEGEPRVLLIALRHLPQAQGIAKVAKAAGIERESLYRALSVNGNPRLSTLVAVTKATGLRLTVEPTQ